MSFSHASVVHMNIVLMVSILVNVSCKKHTYMYALQCNFSNIPLMFIIFGTPVVFVHVVMIVCTKILSFGSRDGIHD